MRIRIGLMTLPILRFLRELFRPNPSPIHRNIRIARVNDLYVLLHLTATVMASGSLTYLVGWPHHALGMRPPMPETLLEKSKISGTEIGG